MPGGSGAVPVREAGDLDTEGTVDEIAATTTTKCDASANGNPYGHPDDRHSYGHPDDSYSYGHPDDSYSNDRANDRHSDSRLDDDHYGAYNVSAAVCITTVSYVADERTLKYIRSAGLSPDGGRGVRGQDWPFVWRERIREIGIGVEFQAMELVNEYITSLKRKECLSVAVPRRELVTKSTKVNNQQRGRRVLQSLAFCTALICTFLDFHYSLSP